MNKRTGKSPSTETEVPAYEQVKNFIKARIHSAVWRPGDPVPSEADLQLQFGISRMTANRALRELAQDGLVLRVKGSGTVVARLDRISSTLEFRDIRDEIRARGHVHATIVEKVESARASAELARVMELANGARVFHSVIVHCENAMPIQLEDRYVNPASAPQYLSVDFKTTTPTHYLLQHAPLTEASFAIESCLASVEEARALHIKAGDPCLVMVRRTLSGPHVASLARLIYPAERYRFHGKFQL